MTTPKEAEGSTPKRSGKEIGELGKFWEDLVRQESGGNSGDINGREIDSITDYELIQAKNVNTKNAHNFLNKKTRIQIKETIEIANQQGKRAVFWFKEEPFPDVRNYIENKGGVVRVGLGEP